MNIYIYLNENIKDILTIIESCNKLDMDTKLNLNNYYTKLLNRIKNITDLNILNKYFENISYNRDIILKNEINFNSKINFINYLYYIED